MSQEPPKPQPPLSPEPKTSKSDTVANGIETTWNRVRSVLKTQSIKALQGTIGVLEGLVEKLAAESPVGKVPSGEGVRQPSFLNKLQLGWSAALEKIRSLLPALNQLSDTVLTGLVAGVIILLVWTTSALLPGKSPEVANVPASGQVSPANMITPPELTAPAAPEPIEVTPLPPVPTPTPTLELTPEQNLIASIENQVAEISDRYADGLIQLIQANFQGSRLTIKVAPDWYNLKHSQQNSLAARMLERSRELDFSQLEITDLGGRLLARSPVVGNDMVILKRQVISDQ